MRAFAILFEYIQAYPRHAYKYLVCVLVIQLCNVSKKKKLIQNDVDWCYQFVNLVCTSIKR